MTASPSVQRLAAQIEELREQILAKRGPQLAYSSIEDGALNEYDAEGTLSSRFGKQFDGTHMAATLAGPTPPTPTGVTAEPVVGGIKVAWGGLFMDDAIVPMDYARTEVHIDVAAPQPGYEAMFVSMRTTIESSRGGEVTVAIPPGEYYVWLIVRSTAGKASGASEIVGPIVPGKVSMEDLDFDPSQFGGGTEIHYGEADPQDDATIILRTGDLWLQVVDAAATPPKTETKRWDGAGWALLQDQGVSTALTEAAAAKIAADAKVRLFTQPDEPQGLTVDDEGDLWLDTDNGHRLLTWDGDSWEPRLLGNGSIQPQSLVASDVIATGTVTTSLLDAQAVTADKIKAGAVTAEKLAAQLILTSRLIAQDALGNTTFDLDGLTGNVSFVGKLATGLPGQSRVEMTKDTALGEHYISFYDAGAVNTATARIKALNRFMPSLNRNVTAIAHEVKSGTTTSVFEVIPTGLKARASTGSGSSYKETSGLGIDGTLAYLYGTNGASFGVARPSGGPIIDGDLLNAGITVGFDPTWVNPATIQVGFATQAGGGVTTVTFEPSVTYFWVPTSMNGTFRTNSTFNAYGTSTFRDNVSFLSATRATFSGEIVAPKMRAKSAVDPTATNRTLDTWAHTGAVDGRIAFVAPASGMVKVAMTALVRSSVLRQYLILDVRVRTGTSRGSGTLVFDPPSNVNEALITTQNDVWERVHGVRLIEGLTPGDSYNVSPVFASYSGQSVSVAGTNMVVEPML